MRIYLQIMKSLSHHLDNVSLFLLAFMSFHTDCSCEMYDGGLKVTERQMSRYFTADIINGI